MHAGDLFPRSGRRRVMLKIPVDPRRDELVPDRRQPLGAFGMERSHLVQQERWMGDVRGRHDASPDERGMIREW